MTQNWKHTLFFCVTKKNVNNYFQQTRDIEFILPFYQQRKVCMTHDLRWTIKRSRKNKWRAFFFSPYWLRMERMTRNIYTYLYINIYINIYIYCFYLFPAMVKNKCNTWEALFSFHCKIMFLHYLIMIDLFFSMTFYLCSCYTSWYWSMLNFGSFLLTYIHSDRFQKSHVPNISRN